jgi:hypothetical protein
MGRSDRGVEPIQSETNEYARQSTGMLEHFFSQVSPRLSENGDAWMAGRGAFARTPDFRRAMPGMMERAV